MADENKQDWQLYIIPDLRTWAFPKEYEQQTKIERFNTLDEAKRRFDELRHKPYIFEKAVGNDGQPSARLTLGVEKGAAAFDILQVRGGENVLVTDFTRDKDFSSDESLLSAIRKVVSDVGFDKVSHYPKLENGKFGAPSLVPFHEWTAENPQYDLAYKPAPLYNKPFAYAKENGEIDKWRNSLRETEKCAKYIEKLIGQYHVDYNLNTDTIIEGAVGRYGTEHVTLALASTIRQKEWDGRFSQKNKDWADSIDFPEEARYKEINVNSHSTLLDAVVKDYREFLLTLEKNLAEKQDISNTEHSQGGTIMAEHNTTFEVWSMMKTNDGGRTKALANLIINGEIAVNNVKVMEGEKGLNVVMPGKKVGNGYEDVAHTTTKEAYAAMKEAVMSSYDKLIASGEEKLKNDLGLDKTKPAVSDIKVTLREVKHDTVKAAGQIKIDDCFVINDVKVMKPKDPEKPLFVSMPSYPNQKGGYTEYALPITTAMHEMLNNEIAVKAFRNMEQVTYKGVKYAELGDKNAGEIAATSKLNNVFAEKLMTELDKAGITYQARIGSNTGTIISVNTADKPRLDEIQKALVAVLNPPKEEKKPDTAAPKQDEKPKQKHSRH